jgi:serine/threonine-protein kinase HipA
MLVVPPSFKGITINTKMRLDHELFSSPETSILKWLGYMHPKKIKMAMKVHSKNTHYQWYKIQARHWISNAKYLGFPESEMKVILEELCSTVPSALIRASESAAPLFNKEIGEAITNGTMECLDKMQRQL